MESRVTPCRKLNPAPGDHFIAIDQQEVGGTGFLYVTAWAEQNLVCLMLGTSTHDRLQGAGVVAPDLTMPMCGGQRMPLSSNRTRNGLSPPVK